MHLREGVKKYDIRIKPKSYNFAEKEIIMLVFIYTRLNKARRNLFLRERERNKKPFLKLKYVIFIFNFGNLVTLLCTFM